MVTQFYGVMNKIQKSQHPPRPTPLPPPQSPNLLNTWELAKNALPSTVPCQLPKRMLTNDIKHLFSSSRPFLPNARRRKWQREREKRRCQTLSRGWEKSIPSVEVSAMILFLREKRIGTIWSWASYTPLGERWTAKKFVDTLFYAMSWIWTSFCLLLIRGEPHRGSHH